MPFRVPDLPTLLLTPSSSAVHRLISAVRPRRVACLSVDDRLRQDDAATAWRQHHTWCPLEAGQPRGRLPHGRHQPGQHPAGAGDRGQLLSRTSIGPEDDRTLWKTTLPNGRLLRTSALAPTNF